MVLCTEDSVQYSVGDAGSTAVVTKEHPEPHGRTAIDDDGRNFVRTVLRETTVVDVE